jgi:hypothetical protein
VTLVRIDVSDQRAASIIRVKRISQLGTSLALTSGAEDPVGIAWVYMVWELKETGKGVMALASKEERKS